MAVMGLAITLGPRMAPATLLAYLAAGAAGLPVFSGTPDRGLGLPYMAGPTGGYLLGYLAASWLTAHLAENRGAWGRFGAMLAGLTLVYALGAAWLATFVPVTKILGLGVLPFLPADRVKIAILALHSLPLLELVGRANAVHRAHHDPNRVQKASLLSIKTGGCPEDCAYCPQSAHHREVALTRDRLMDPEAVIALAGRAQAAGAERFCMGARCAMARSSMRSSPWSKACAHWGWRPASPSAC